VGPRPNCSSRNSSIGFGLFGLGRAPLIGNASGIDALLLGGLGHGGVGTLNCRSSLGSISFRIGLLHRSISRALSNIGFDPSAVGLCANQLCLRAGQARLSISVIDVCLRLLALQSRIPDTLLRTTP